MDKFKHLQEEFSDVTAKKPKIHKNKGRENPSLYLQADEEYFCRKCNEFFLDLEVIFLGNIPHCPMCDSKLQKV